MSAIRSKLDSATESVKAKYAEQQTGAHGMGVKDRWRVARGENVRWQQTRSESNSGEVGEEYSSGGAGIRHRLPPPPPGAAAGSGGRAPPPARGARAPPPPARAGAAAPPLPSAPKPRLPPRMNNEAGIDNPPPPYIPSHADTASTTSSFAPVRTFSPSQSLDEHDRAIEFSRFSYRDKRQFFGLLDEYFASKGANVSPA